MKRLVLGAALAILFAASAPAQSLEGFEVGAKAASGLAAHAKPQREQALGNDIALAWDLKDGPTLSMTWSPASGKVLFIEKDWVRGTPVLQTGVPGLVFGQTHLADIRTRFGSNGFGFKANAVVKNDDSIAFINCFEIAGHDGLVLAVVTVVHSDQFAEFLQHPDSGRAVLETVILADHAYLTALWGDEFRREPHYHPVEWK